MNAYQSGIAKFEGMDAQVIGISTDMLPTLSHWADELKVAFPLASDFMRKVSASYGVLIENRGIASRTTFVVGKDGRIAYIEEGSGAIDPTGAATACSRVHKK